MLTRVEGIGSIHYDGEVRESLAVKVRCFELSIAPICLSADPSYAAIKTGEPL